MLTKYAPHVWEIHLEIEMAIKVTRCASSFPQEHDVRKSLNTDVWCPAENHGVMVSKERHNILNNNLLTELKCF